MGRDYLARQVIGQLPLLIIRTNISTISGKAERELTRKSIVTTGVTVHRDCTSIALLMVVTLLPYGLLQVSCTGDQDFIVKLSYIIGKWSSRSAAGEKWWALTGMIVCAILFALYSVYQVLDVRSQERKMQKVKEARMWRRVMW